MAVATGSQIRPELSAVNYAPYLQATGQAAQMQARGAENIAAGLANLGQQAGAAIKDYSQEKKAQQSMMGTIGAAEKLSSALSGLMSIKDERGNSVLDPRIAKSIEEVNSIISNKDGRSIEERYAASQSLYHLAPMMINAGAKLYDIQSDIGQKKAVIEQKTNDSRAIGVAMRPYLPGDAPEGIARPAAKFDPAKFLSDYTNAGGSTKGIQDSDQIIKMLTPKDATKLTTAMQNTEAILSSEIAAGKIDSKDINSINVRRSELLAQGGSDKQTQHYQPGPSMVDENHNFIGTSVFDQKTGKTKLLDVKTGEFVDIPSNARPSTVGQLGNTQLPPAQFTELRDRVHADELSLGKFSDYMKSVEGSKYGVSLVADKFAANMKTLFTSGKLTPTQLASAKSEGDLQALIGSSRLSVLGPGVMTEQDAVRVIQYLGGNSDSLRNPEKVKQAISTVYNDRYKMYVNNLESYNIQQGNYYRQYSPAAKIEIDEKFIPKQTPTFDAEADRRRLKELEDKSK